MRKKKKKKKKKKKHTQKKKQHLIWGTIYRRAIKEGSKVINHDNVNNHAYS